VSVPQHMVALAKANEVRRAGRDIRREVGAGQLPFADALEDARAQRVEIFELLCAQRGWGPQRARQTLTPLFIGEQRQVRQLTDRQCRVLALAVSANESERLRRAVA
jgi:hypothetical protein